MPEFPEGGRPVAHVPTDDFRSGLVPLQTLLRGFLGQLGDLESAWRRRTTDGEMYGREIHRALEHDNYAKAAELRERAGVYEDCADELSHLVRLAELYLEEREKRAGVS